MFFDSALLNLDVAGSLEDLHHTCPTLYQPTVKFSCVKSGGKRRSTFTKLEARGPGLASFATIPGNKTEKSKMLGELPSRRSLEFSNAVFPVVECSCLLQSGLLDRLVFVLRLHLNWCLSRPEASLRLHLI
jgi:hypothetical protein